MSQLLPTKQFALSAPNATKNAPWNVGLTLSPRCFFPFTYPLQLELYALFYSINIYLEKVNEIQKESTMNKDY